MYRLIWLVPLLPLLGAAINGLLGRKLRFSERTIAVIAVGTVALSFLISVAAVYSYGTSERWPRAYVTSEEGRFPYSFTWISGGAVEITQGAPERARAVVDERSGAQSGSEKRVGEEAARDRSPNERTGSGSDFNVQWSYQLDSLSAVFMLIVTGVGLCIFIFATGYMHGDQGYYRFFAYLGLFMFSMLVLVMGSNFVMMFVGWEGVGLCSYLLIGYYFDRKEAGDASRKAFITNRIGDFGFALAIFGIIATFGTAQYTNVMTGASSYPLEPLGQWGLMSWIALGLFIGAIGKSAQIPLYVWLPDAMAGPTPVSALIHAATMVTAGLYMLTRTNVIFQHSQTMMLVVASHRRGDGYFRRDHRLHAERHQESPCLLDRLAAWLYVSGLRSGRIHHRHLSRHDARLLQGAHVPRRRKRHPRHASRAGHAAHGRLEEVHAYNLLDFLRRLVSHLRHHSL